MRCPFPDSPLAAAAEAKHDLGDPSRRRLLLGAQGGGLGRARRALLPPAQACPDSLLKTQPSPLAAHSSWGSKFCPHLPQEITLRDARPSPGSGPSHPLGQSLEDKTPCRLLGPSAALSVGT